MIELKHACLGVRCPCCGKNIIEYINRFQFASGTSIKCSYCDAPLISIKKQSHTDNVSINCFACGELHTYSVSKKSFLSGTSFSFGCKKNEVDVLYTGNYEDVDNALFALDKEINNLTEMYYDNLQKKYGLCIISALRILEEKAKQKRIICMCGSYELNLKLSEGGIELVCPNCGGSEFIPIATENDVKSLLERRSILIK